MDRNSYNTRDPVLVLTSKGQNHDPVPPEPEYVQNVTGREAIDVTGTKFNKIVSLVISKDDGNSATLGSDDGLYVPSATEDIVDGKGTKVINVTSKSKIWDKIKRLFGYQDTPKIAIDLVPPTDINLGGIRKSIKDGNALDIDKEGNAFVAETGIDLVDGIGTSVQANLDEDTTQINLLPPDKDSIGGIKQKANSKYLKITQDGIADVTIPNSDSDTLGLVKNSKDTNNATIIEDGLLKTIMTQYQNQNVKQIIAQDGIKGSIENNILTLTADSPVAKNDYYCRWELSELAGFDGLDTRSSITWSDYAVASPVVGLKVPKDGIGQAMGFDTEFFNKNSDGSGQREYRVKLKFSVITDAGVSGSSTITIGKSDIWDQNDGAFHMWTAGIEPEIDYSNDHTDRTDIYTFVVDNFRVTPITITLNKTVWIENRLRKFYFGISMKGWFPVPDTANYKLYDYVELFLEEVTSEQSQDN